MCNFIKANGEQCKLARNKDRCGKHQIIALEENNLEVSIVEEMSPQVNTPVIAEVVDTPAPSVIKPVEVSNVEVSKVPELDESIVEPVIAEGVVYEEDQSSDLELNNSNDEYEDDFFFENHIEPELCIQYDVKENSLDITATVGAFEEYLDTNDIDVVISEKTDKRAYEDGYHYCFYIQQGNKTIAHYYCKNKQMMLNIPIMLDDLNVTDYCVANALYDSRLYKLCCMMKRSWFNDNNNTWNLAGLLYRKQHVDLDLMRTTHLCILSTMTARFDQAAALSIQ
ncbi:hypothetical protein AM588_10005491 [Phytophthora nicotianae]|uniref:Uncharacterized protein n=1 Tax=Phytophthora nicotianae TaxID=4792 RepID=A0A0W8DG98_PHYNI|nr:hypothetical protein AM588_10005491 [Phytophthora nicotianae]